MKKVFATITAMAVVLGLANTTEADEKKNPPKNKNAVLEILKLAGEEHFPEKLKITRDVGSMKSDETYYHVFCGQSKEEDGYRVILFDNKPEYLGYYSVGFEPAELSEGEIMLDSGDADEDGNPIWFIIPVGKKGPGNTRVDGTPTPFVKNKLLEQKTAKDADSKGVGTLSVPEQKTSKGKTIDYREWKINRGGKTLTAEAIFVKKIGSSVELKDAKMGKIAKFPLRELSTDDIKYLKEIGEL
ncbi:MAG TPA: hypothetical protein VIR63_01785 [Pontiella sp.]